MTADDFKAAFSALADDRQSLLLAAAAHNLTVCARDAYRGQSRESDAARVLAAYNEMQHTMTGQLAKILGRSEARYSDDAFVASLFEEARRGGCEQELAWALELAVKYLPRPGDE